MITDKIVIPLLKAIITGILVSCFAASWFVDNLSWRMFLIVLSGICLLSWLLLILPGSNSNSKKKSENFRIFPNTKNQRGNFHVETTKIEIISRDPAGQFMSGRFADLPISWQDLANIAKRLQAGSSFSHAGLAGPGRPLSRSQYETLRDEFIARGLAYWINPSSHAQGVELTRAGRAVMQHFATEVVQVLPMGNSLPQLPELSLRRDNLQSAAHAHRRTSGNGREALLRD